MEAVEIAAVTDPGSCRQVEDLQREAWGMPDRGIVPAEQIRAVIHNGGLLLLATVDGAVVGFCYAFVGLDEGTPILCSHMLAVRPAQQSQGIGRALKLAQRRHAAARGFAWITWTFDPLQARNAYLNLHRLGARARRYLVDHYGPMDDEINRGMPTDRLLAEWPVTEDRTTLTASASDTVSGAADAPPAADAASGAQTPPAAVPSDTPWLLPAAAGGRLLPGTENPDALRADVALVAVPTDLDRLRAHGGDAVGAWRTALRSALSSAFDAGMTAVDLARDARRDVAAYVLSRTP